MKKQEITLDRIFKRMDALYEDMMNKFDVLMDKLNVETAVEKENFTTEIPNTEYVTITADDVFVGGQPAKEYHGQEIYNLYHCPAYFKEARDIIREENGCELLEIHCLQSTTNGEYAKPGNPIADKKGENSWVRIKFKDTDGQEKTSLWVFGDSNSSADGCARYCASDCGDGARDYSALRGGLFGSVRN